MKTAYDQNGKIHAVVETFDDGGHLLIYRLDSGKYMTKSKGLLRGKLHDSYDGALAARHDMDASVQSEVDKFGAE
jgi:hypothetical protein